MNDVLRRHLLLALNKKRKGLRRQLSENYIVAIVNLIHYLILNISFLFQKIEIIL